jgi:Cu/Ag efflux protein CusF
MQNEFRLGRWSSARAAMALVVGMGMLAGCRKLPSAAATPSSTATAAMKRYHLQGVIVSRAPKSQEVVVRHGAIAGLMPPMTMIYKVQDPAAFAKLQAGDQISSDVLTTGFDDKLFLENIVVTAEPRSAQGDLQAVPVR